MSAWFGGYWVNGHIVLHLGTCVDESILVFFSIVVKKGKADTIDNRMYCASMMER